MKKYFLLIAAMLFLAGFGSVAKAQSKPSAPPPPPGRQLKLVLSRQSNVDPVEIVKHLSRECPSVTLTTSTKDSDYMLHAGGWSGNYRFMVIAHGGAMIYATETSLLSNAVKDVCKFLNTRAPAPTPASY